MALGLYADRSRPGRQVGKLLNLPPAHLMRISAAHAVCCSREPAFANSARNGTKLDDFSRDRGFPALCSTRRGRVDASGRPSSRLVQEAAESGAVKPLRKQPR